MRSIASVRIVGVIVGAAAVALIGSACGTDDSGESTPTSAEASAVETSASDEATADTSPTAGASKVAQAASVKVGGARGVEVTLTGPIAERFSSTTAAEKKILRLPLTGSRNAGTRESGVVYQQFEGGVITARNDHPGTPAYLTYGKIRDAWNVERNDQGVPTVVGTNGSAGPLGPVTSDLVTRGHVQTTRFEHGSISHDTKSGTVTVTVNGKVVPTE
ncbi:LGFP repeat-containing protein [Gordonia sp. (in: high G+C Gram-positive bacteria)]|uniref:LGFP repeat-containing protein n=1 Tax=Gordonia sp. (in: high G+C Gram-positive bacteria) TaxID=84139 RepID=UPI003F9C33D8